MLDMRYEKHIWSAILSQDKKLKKRYWMYLK